MKKMLGIYIENSEILHMLLYKLSNSEQYEPLCFSSYKECLQVSQAIRPDYYILQLTSPACEAEDLMYNMQFSDFNPTIVMFFVMNDNSVQYAISDTELTPFSESLAELFLSSINSKYSIVQKTFRTSSYLKDGTDFYYHSVKMEVLRELIRGCSAKESSVLIKQCDLDLRNNGYYLFFRELQSTEYIEHRTYKDILNFIGNYLTDSYYTIINSYLGGEYVALNHHCICIIINVNPEKDSDKPSPELSEILRRLVKTADCHFALSYITGFIPHTMDFCYARNNYASQKIYGFFCKNHSFMLASDAIPSRELSITRVQGVVQTIVSYIRYDIRNPNLLDQIHLLFFDCLKPMKSYTMYYYSTAQICSELASIQDSYNEDDLRLTLDPEKLKFSSIEEQYETLISIIKKIQAAKEPASSLKRPVLLKVMKYIQEHYMEDITVNGIADYMNISRSYLSQIFSDELNTSISSYIIDTRMDHAKSLLLGTDQLIYEIALAVGYPDSAYFTKAFKKNVGMLPMEFRKSGKYIRQI